MLGKLQRAHPTLRGHFAPAYLVGSNMLRAYLFFIYGRNAGWLNPRRVDDVHGDVGPVHHPRGHQPSLWGEGKAHCVFDNSLINKITYCKWFPGKKKRFCNDVLEQYKNCKIKVVTFYVLNNPLSYSLYQSFRHHLFLFLNFNKVEFSIFFKKITAIGFLRPFCNL